MSESSTCTTQESKDHSRSSHKAVADQRFFANAMERDDRSDHTSPDTIHPILT